MHAYDALKRRLIRELSGRVLEIGAGRGANFAHLRSDTEWIGMEPRRNAARFLRSTLERNGRPGRVLTAPAEDIPLGDHTVDAVLGTVVLCSVRDQTRVLAEVRRVLRPGGRFVFCEHVAAAPGTGSRRAQRFWAPMSRLLDHGCDPTRETARTITAAGFAEVDLRWFCMRAFGVTVPFVVGHGVA